MAMTMTQKIIAAHAGLDHVRPGQLVTCHVDLVLSNDITAPVAIHTMEDHDMNSVFDPSKIAMIPDHFAPAKDIKSAEQCKVMRDFAKAHKVEHYYEVGKMGVEHCLLPEQGIVRPGELIIGADSHTCTYGAIGAFSTGMGSTDIASAMVSGKTWLKVPEAVRVNILGKPTNPWVSGKDVVLALIGKMGVDGALYQSLEYTGDGLQHLSMESRLTIANMAVEGGAKNAIFPVDNICREYMSEVYGGDYAVYEADPDAEYIREISIDLSELEPQVAFPHLPSNTKGISEAEAIPMDQVVIGSCTNGRIEDMRAMAEVLKGHKVAPFLRLIVIPGTQKVYQQCMDEGIMQIVLDAGGVFSTPTCGPCLGGYMGILAAGERALTTTNRNFVGRMGHPESEVYLANPAIAAATAVLGRIASPEEVQA